MRKIKEILRLKFELGLGNRQIARSCSINHRGGKARSQPPHLASAFISALFVFLSLYYAYAGYLYMLFMAYNQKFNPYSEPFHFATNWQFYSLLLALLFFVDFVVYDLASADRYAHSQPVGGN